MDKSKASRRVQDQMGRLMHHDEQKVLSLREGWHWDDNKGRWLDLNRAPRQVEKKWSTSSPQGVHWSPQTRAPIKTGWAETDKGQPEKPNVRARWVAKEYKTYTRPKLYAPTPPLEAADSCAVGDRHGQARERLWHL